MHEMSETDAQPSCFAFFEEQSSRSEDLALGLNENARECAWIARLGKAASLLGEARSHEHGSGWLLANHSGAEPPLPTSPRGERCHRSAAGSAASTTATTSTTLKLMSNDQIENTGVISAVVAARVRRLS